MSLPFGIDLQLLLLGSAGGWLWLMRRDESAPRLPAWRTASTVALSAIVAASFVPAALAWGATAHIWPEAVPSDLMRAPLSFVLGYLANGGLARAIDRRADRV